MKIYNVSVLDDSGVLSVEAKAFRKKEEAEKFANDKVEDFLNDFPDSERYDSEDHIYAQNDDYLISVDILTQEI